MVSEELVVDWDPCSLEVAMLVGMPYPLWRFVRLWVVAESGEWWVDTEAVRHAALEHLRHYAEMNAARERVGLPRWEW